MIDRFGNKIVPAKDKEPDPVTVKNEFRFLMKGFAASPSDFKGKLIAVKGEWLAARLGNLTEQEEMLRLLEQAILAMDSYCAHSKSKDIPWYMGWLCRNLYSAGRITRRYRTEPFDDIGYCCKFFERYREVEPTNQGKNILVNVYTVQASVVLQSGSVAAVRQALEAAKKQRASQENADAQGATTMQLLQEGANRQALQILEKARACEESIDPNYARHNRFSVSASLYAALFDVYTRLHMKQEAFVSIQKATAFSLRHVQEQPSNTTFKQLCQRYCNYAEHELYDFSADPLNMDQVIALTDAYAKKTLFSTLGSSLEKLKRLRSQFNP